MYCSMKLSTFGHVISRHPRNEMTIDNPMALSTDTTTYVLPKALRYHLLHHLLLMKGKTDRHLSDAHRRFKNHFGQPISDVPTFTLGQSVFVDWLQYATLEQLHADEIANTTYSEPMTLTVGPYLIIHVHFHTITIDEDIILNTIFINCKSIAPHPNKDSTHNETIEATEQSRSTSNTQQLPKCLMHLAMKLASMQWIKSITSSGGEQTQKGRPIVWLLRQRRHNRTTR